MPEHASHNGEELHRRLYPVGQSFDAFTMDVPGNHQIYVEQSGNPTGQPVIVLHGGPGGGCSPAMRRFFDPEKFHVILFDQRGCGRSRPHASVENNTTWDLVADIELIRERLGIDRWIVFGGSWGATLALLYAQTHPDRARALVLRGVFTMTRAELDWFYGGGAGQFWPEAWEHFTRPIPEDERGDMIAAYNSRLFGPIESEVARYARAWTAWENALAVLGSSGNSYAPGTQYARAFARLENHYFINGGFLEEDGQILRDLPRIAHIEGHIVQGRYDMICPPHTAYSLHKAWPASRLHMVTEAGHAMSEPGIALRLVQIMDELRNI